MLDFLLDLVGLQRRPPEPKPWRSPDVVKVYVGVLGGRPISEACHIAGVMGCDFFAFNDRLYPCDQDLVAKLLGPRDGLPTAPVMSESYLRAATTAPPFYELRN